MTQLGCRQEMKTRADPPGVMEQYGLLTVRGAEVIEVKDEGAACHKPQACGVMPYLLTSSLAAAPCCLAFSTSVHSRGVEFEQSTDGRPCCVRRQRGA